jgi:superoxide reductase
MSERKFYLCERCGNLVGLIHEGGGELSCCGQPMKELVPNTTDASHEKHVPVVTIEGGAVHVQVGSAAHPMTEAHSIQWIYLCTETGGQRRCLKPGDAPEATFLLQGEKPVAVYAYCNLHGLWETKLD